VVFWEREVREMRRAETILNAVRERGRRGLPLERVYRLLYNPELYLTAYGKIYRNAGALTPGSTEETADGMSLAKIEAITGALRDERYRWRPARRVYIEKPRSNKNKRPLGIPSWSDKLPQEVIRLILEAYYEPQFSDRSHGFRPGRGCHSALTEIQRKWSGTTWFIEGDISDCFGSLDHTILLSILSEKIHDGRFLRLIENLLKAGYLEEWRFNATLSGTPQGGVLSPILSNIYLDRLDKFVEGALLPDHNRKAERATNPEYSYLQRRAHKLAKQGRKKEADVLRKRMRGMPSRDQHDPDFRRLRYVRYADDFLLGYIGVREEAERIKRQLEGFMRDSLKLELSEPKTLITHGRTQAARFLGYEVVVLHDDTKQSPRGRAINGIIGLKVPADVVRAKCAPYQKGGKPIHRAERLNDDVFSIIAGYQLEFRGIAEYYRLAYNLSTRLNRLRWVMEQSLTKTLASKLRISVPKVYRRYQSTIQTERGPYKVLRVEVRRKGKKPLVAQWGGVSLARRKDAVLNDQPKSAWNTNRTELLERLLADQCELCGSHEGVQVHHVRSLKDLKRKGRAEKPGWVKQMASRQRKTLVVCQKCHTDIHAGRHSKHAREADLRHQRAG
jgi:group II intron reverse transcriptase/maturase